MYRFANRPPSARHPCASGSPVRSTERRRGSASWAVNAVAAVVILGLGAGAFFAWNAHRQSSEPDRRTDTPPPPTIASDEVRFTDITDEVGIDFVHDPGHPSFFNPEIFGSGVALLDFDQDGRLDIYFRSGTGGPPHPLARPDTPRATSRLFHQQPDGRFVDVTESSGLGDPGYGMGVAVGDLNNDSYPDVYVANFGPDRLYLNQRDGTFVDVTASSGIANDKWGSSACLVDFDRDGRLDVFVTNYVEYSRYTPCTLAHGREDYCNPKEFPGTADVLFRNVTDVEAAKRDTSAVRFEDVSVSCGIAAQPGPGLGVRAGDFNDDGWPDMYVANDGKAKFMWMNQRDGTFRDLAVPLGSAFNAVGQPTASMGIAEGDVDGDGQLDLVVTNLRGEASTLYRRSSTGFVDATASSNVQRLSSPHTGWGIALPDLDHDGDLDMVVANGLVYQLMDRPALRPPPPEPPDSAAVARFWQAYADSNQVLLNNGRGHFAEISAQVGTFAQQTGSSRGLATGDLDGDGDLDCVVMNLAGRARVYRNDSHKRGRWLRLRVVDPARGGRDACGALVTVVAGGKKWVRPVQPGTSYQSSDDPLVHFGLGPVERIDYIDVRWPDGTNEVERFEAVPLDSNQVLRRGEGKAL